MRVKKIRALYGCHIWQYAVRKPANIAPDLVKRNFDVIQQDKAWVTDMTYVRPWEGRPYLAVEMNLSRD